MAHISPIINKFEVQGSPLDMPVSISHLDEEFKNSEEMNEHYKP